MVFSSNSAYHDASNWQLQQNNHHHQIIGNSSVNSLLPPLQPQPSQSLQTPLPQLHGGSGSIRPGSMSERARMANINGPEIALECPRCKSTNTKFCYYNNYSLTQPRHFCKACRRYWTKGGALRSVPVGGGCRRNKRTKSTTSKLSPVNTDMQTISSSTNNNISSSNVSTSLLGLTTPQFPPTRFLSPLMSQITNNHHNFTSEMNYSNISAPIVGSSEMNFSNLFGTGGVASFLSSSGTINEAWRPPQFPFSEVNHMDSSPLGSYPFNNGGESAFEGVFRPPSKLSSSMLSQMASLVKTEDHNKEKSDQLNLSRQILGIQGNDNIQWNNNHSSNSSSAAWTELSNFGSSSSNNL